MSGSNHGYGKYGHWQQTRGTLGAMSSTPLGGWAGTLFADGPRTFVSPFGEVMGHEGAQHVINARAPGASVYGGSVLGETPTEQVVTSTLQATPGQKFSDTLTQLAPTISTIIEATQDPFRRYEVSKAKLENAQMRGASPAHLNKLQAKVDAAGARLGLKQESVMATRQWRTLGQTAVVVGIGVGLTLGFFVLVKALATPSRRTAT